MTKRIIALAMMVISLLALAGCACDHDWESGDCTTPKTCEKCGKTKGEALGHEWADATCTTPKTCIYCGETKGSVSGHSWTPASCTSPSVCMNCGKVGTVADHDWTAPTCTTPSTCRNCYATQGGVIDHDWVSDSSTNTKHCTMCGLEASYTPNGTGSGSSSSGVRIGDTITMGYYGNEEIEWIVLDYDPYTDQALVISKYCLDAIPYHAGSTYGSWENSTLRRWLNNAFIGTAFSPSEQDRIVLTHLTNPDNPDFDVDGGNDTDDRIFLLSYEEAVYYFPSQNSRKCQPTAYCLEQGCYDPVKWAEEHNEICEPEAVGYTWWWLRTPGKDSSLTCNVLAKGIASSRGASQTSGEGTIRPAMWIRLG